MAACTLLQDICQSSDCTAITLLCAPETSSPDASRYCYRATSVNSGVDRLKLTSSAPPPNRILYLTQGLGNCYKSSLQRYLYVPVVLLQCVTTLVHGLYAS